MAMGLWRRLNLRWQAVFAVLLPCVLVALFSSLYFPRRLNLQAEESLQDKALALGALASSEVAPALRLIEDGLAQPEDLDNLFEGAAQGRARRKGAEGVKSEANAGAGAEVDLSGSDIDYIAVLRVSRGATEVFASPDRVVRKAVQRLHEGGSRELPKVTFGVPRAEATEVGGTRTSRCVVDQGETLGLRCHIRDEEGAVEGLLVAGFRKDELRAAQQDNLFVGIWSGLGAALLGLVLAIVYGRALSEPVERVTQAAKEVASGDISVSMVDVTAAGEIRSMATSFNEMLSSLRNLVGQMVSLTEQLGAASNGLIGASKDQEHVTNQQAAYAQEIAATFEELSRTAEKISASTDVVETAAKNTNAAVTEAKAVFAEVVEGIQNIRAESKDVAEAITRLNSDLLQVSKIAQVINAVAERSDLLALNAALEGTKAGEVGRGFSLVAAEMRKLAENVSGSAQDIERLVEQVQESSSQAVSKANRGVEVSDHGVQVAEQASQLFQRIAELARGTTEASRQISVATRQQKQSSEQAVLGARNVADLVKQGVDATGRTTRIAQDLESVAKALNSVTGRFRVRREDAPN